MTNDQVQNDTPVEIYGYKTDPLRRGYQILWNYESTYWAALVGNNDAWRLYEVLRSFCHDKNPTCNPSINLLLAILSVEDRRVLTGRIKQVKEKEYKYPGLIDILQTHGLAIAEVKGEGPEMRYIFHVNLTPELLTAEQLAKLPLVLQQKHKELLERCEQAKQELEAKRKPSKVQKDDQRGMGNSHTPLWEIPIPPMGISHPNNTNTTLPIKYDKQQSPKENNNSGSNGKQSVVVALIKLGITEKVTQRLANRHKEDRIFQKIDYINYELAHDVKIRSVAGRLRRMIEDDWAAPAGYTPDWRDQEAAEKARIEQARQEQEALEASLVAENDTERKEQEQYRQEQLTALRSHYTTSEKEKNLWERVIGHLAALNETAKKFLAGSELLSVQDQRVVIWLPVSDFVRTQIERQYSSAITRLLAKELQTDFNELTLEWILP